MTRFVQHSTAPFVPDEVAYVRACVERAGFRPALKRCFANAKQALTGDAEERLTYAEGLVLAVRWCHHGWLLLDGRVVDLTLSARRFGLTPYLPRQYAPTGLRVAVPIPTEYWGVTLDRSEVLATIERVDGWMAMLPPTAVLDELAARIVPSDARLHSPRPAEAVAGTGSPSLTFRGEGPRSSATVSHD